MTQFGFTPAALRAAGEADVVGFAAPEDMSTEAAAALPSQARQTDAPASGAAMESAQAAATGKRNFFASLFSSPPARPSGPDRPEEAAGAETPGAVEPKAGNGDDATALREDADAAEPGFFASLFAPAPEEEREQDGSDTAAAAETPDAAERTASARGEEANERDMAAHHDAGTSEPGFFASLFSPAPEEEDGPEEAGAGAETSARSVVADDASAPARQDFLMALLSPSEEASAGQTTTLVETMEEKIEDDTVRAAPIQASLGGEVLPGVRDSEQLFEVVRKSNIDDISDVDLYEGEGTYQTASAAGLARLAPHGLLKQRDDVDVACFKPELVRMLKTVERRFGKRVVVTSGYRSPAHNRRVRGARRSQHMVCAAADIQLAGVSKWELARFVRSLPGRGGVGTYCHTKSVHVDVGPERDWNWRCRD